jgi:hypothetical protein
VGSSPIVEIAELEESTSEMVLGERDQEVETLPAEGSDESLAESVGLGSSGRSLENLDAEVCDRRSCFGREQDVTVEDEEAIGNGRKEELRETAGRPTDMLGGR